MMSAPSEWDFRSVVSEKRKPYPGPRQPADRIKHGRISLSLMVHCGILGRNSKTYTGRLAPKPARLITNEEGRPGYLPYR